MNKDSSLLLFVDVKDMLHHKTKLENTKSYDSTKEKNKQVGENIINNSWVLYNKIADNKINDEINNRFHSLKDIECNENNEKEPIEFRLLIPRNTAADFKKYVTQKCGDSQLVNLELINILRDTVQNHLEQQQTTTKSIRFNGRNPPTFVLKRLEQIARELDGNYTAVFSGKRLTQIITDTLDNPDPRTLKPYFKCLEDFASSYGGITMGFEDKLYNLSGFSDTVRKLLDANR